MSLIAAKPPARNVLSALSAVDGVALSDSAAARYCSFAALYFAQGLPVGLLATAFPAWLAQQGLGTAEIGGFVAFTLLPWTLKIVWGPLLDRFSYLPMGRRRPWIIFAQTGLICSFLALAFVPDPVANLRLLSLVGFVISVWASLQDVAVDGLAIEVLPIDQQGRANGVMFGAQRLGLAAAAAGGAVLLSSYGLIAVAGAGAGLVGEIMLFPLLLRERLGERLFPWTRGEAAAAAMELQQREWKPIIGGVLKAMILPASLTIVTLSFIDRVGFGAILAVRPVVFVQSLGWATTEYAQLLAIYGLMNAVGAVLVGATFAAQAAIKRTAQHQREMLPPLKVAG